MSTAMSERIMKSGIIVIIAHVIFKIAGLVQASVLSARYSSGQTDAYVLAFEGVLFMIYLIGEESIGPAFLPVFSELRNNDDEKGAWNFARGLLFLQSLILIGVTALIMADSELVLKSINFLSGKGFTAGSETDRFAVPLLRLMAPGLIGLSLGSTTYMILNGFKRFFWAAFGDALTKISVIIGVLVFSKTDPVAALGVGVAIGGFAKLAGHLWGMRDRIKDLFSGKPVIKSPAFRKFIVLIAPLIIGILIAKVRDTVNNILVLNNVDSEGILTANSWGKKIFNAAGWFVPYGLSIAMFPYFCDMIDKDNRKELGKFMTDASKMLLLFFVPLAAGGVILSLPIVRLIFDHGRFEMAFETSVANICYMLVLPFFSLEYFFMQGFFADRRMITPTVLGIVFSFFSMIVSYVFVILLQVDVKYGPVFAIVAVALGFTLSRSLKVICLIYFFRKKIPVFQWDLMKVFLVKLFLITAAVAVPAVAARWATGMLSGVQEGRKIFLAIQILVSTGAGAVGFFIAVKLFKVEEFDTAFKWTVSKIRGKKNENPAGS